MDILSGSLVSARRAGALPSCNTAPGHTQGNRDSTQSGVLFECRILDMFRGCGVCPGTYAAAHPYSDTGCLYTKIHTNICKQYGSKESECAIHQGACLQPSCHLPPLTVIAGIIACPVQHTVQVTGPAPCSVCRLPSCNGGRHPAEEARHRAGAATGGEQAEGRLQVAGGGLMG